MKKVILVLMFLMLVGGVSAMESPIKVQTNAGYGVSVFAWVSGGGPVISSDMGAADEDGFFETKTFFSLRVPYKLNIVIRDLEGSIARNFDEEVGGIAFNVGIDADCRGSTCILTASEVEEEVVEEVVEENVTAVENVTVVENETVVVEESKGFVATGKAIFSRDDGSLNLGYSIGGGVILLFMFVFVFMVLHRGKRKGSLDGDDKELKYMEKKVAETAEKIKGVKDGRVKREQIYKAKVKLAEEEKELQELEAGGNSKKIEEQEDVVEKAEDKVEDKVEEAKED